MFSCRPYEWPFYFGFLIPFAVIYIFNWVVFLVIMISLCRHSSAKTAGQRDNKSMVARYLLIAVILSLLFGLGWVFGLIGTSSLPRGVSIPAQYLFSIFIGLQGVLVFILHAIRSPDSRDEWKRWWYSITCRAEQYRVFRTASITGTTSTTRQENIYSTNATFITQSESFHLGTKAGLEAGEKQPLSLDEEKKPEEVEVSVTVFANVKVDLAKEEKKKESTSSAAQPLTKASGSSTEEEDEGTTTKL